MTTDNRPNYSAWNISLPSPEQRADFAAIAPALAWYGHLAPNTHNTQPWRFEAIRETRAIDIFVEPGRVLPESDKDSRQAQISIGAAIKNMEIAAHALGWKPDLVITPGDGERVATLQLEYAGERGPLADLVDTIPVRKTNRGRYDRSRALPCEIEGRLAGIAKGHQVEIRLIKDQLSKAAIADLQEKADSVVINSPRFAQELADWIIMEDSESGLGMPGSGFGLAPERIQSVINSLSNGLATDLDLRKALPQADREGINSAYAELIIMTSDDRLSSRLYAGMAYQQVALELTGIGWATAMNAAFVEVPAFSLLLKTRLREFRNSPMVVCRIGQPLPPEAGEVSRGHSPRLPLSDVFHFTE